MNANDPRDVAKELRYRANKLRTWVSMVEEKALMELAATLLETMPTREQVEAAADADASEMANKCGNVPAAKTRAAQQRLIDRLYAPNG